MYGQIWAMDDCLYRNKEQGNGWTLFVDIDELVVLPGVARGLKGLADALEEQKYESANFHSVGYIASACEEEEDMWPGGSRKMGLADRIVYRAIFPENCEDIWQSNCTFMNKLAQGGRRKARLSAAAEELPHRRRSFARLPRCRLHSVPVSFAPAADLCHTGAVA